MKTFGIISLFIIVAAYFLLSALVLRDADTPEKEPELSSLTVSFYNTVDNAKSMPYMSLIFSNISDANVEKVKQWRAEIDAEIKKQGGVVTDDDYKKISPVIINYVSRFTETNATSVAMEFPRLKKGILLINKKAGK